jgi:hypothetical protein
VAKSEKRLLAILTFAWAVLYLPHLIVGQTLPSRDVSATQFAWRSVWREQVLSGSPPLWDPYSNGGRPLLADPNTMAAYPGSLLFLLTTPEHAAGWHIALHHLLLIFGCYWLARRSGAGTAAAAVAAAAVGTCGVAWSALTFLNFQASLTWAVWALGTTLPPPPPGAASLRRGLAGGALIGLAFLGGEPVTAGLAAVTWFVVVLATWRPLPVAALVAMTGAAAAVAAPVLVPLLAIYPETVRGSMRPAVGALSADALAPRRFLELLFPNLLGPPLADLQTGFWAAPSFPWQRYYPVIFVGGASLLCLPFAGRGRRSLAPWWAIASIGVGSAFLLSIPALAARAQELPFFGSTRYAIKFLTLTVLALPPLIAAGWEGVSEGWNDAGRWWARAVLAAVLLLSPFALAPDRLLRPALATLYPASAPALAEVPASRLRGAAVRDLAALALPAATLALAGPVTIVATAAIVVADWIGGSGVLLFADSARWATPPAACAALPPHPVLAVLQPPEEVERYGTAPPIERYWAPHVALLPESGTRWGAAYVLTRGPDGLEPVHQELLAAASAHMNVEERARLARAVGATAVICRGPIPGWRGIAVGDLWVGVVDRPSPRAYLAQRLLPANEMLTAATTMAAKSFCAGEDAVVVGSGGARESAGGAVIELPGKPYSRRFGVTAEGAGLLVVQQSFMRCWRATVDGRPAQAEPVNGACIGIRVPAGRHRIALFLDPIPYWVGLSGPLLLLLVVGLSRRAVTSRGRAAASGEQAHSTPAIPPAHLP